MFTLHLIAVAATGAFEHQRWHAAVDQLVYESKHGKSDRLGVELAKPQYAPQRQDNFDGANPFTWQQAYYVNDTFWEGAGNDAPVFLCVGGEGPPLDGSAVLASPHCNIAVEYLQEKKAIMFAVEHRYYGCHNMSACPVPSFKSNGSLKFLSSRQALADLANFHQFASQKYGLTAGNKWISFGGSYPGMLAGWFRLKYPHLVHGSIASSAPVQAKLDMQGYNDVAAVAYSVSDNNVGGSPACREAIASGHAQIKTFFGTSSGRSTLAKLFGQDAKWYASPGNQASFAGNGVAYFPSQGNDPSCSAPACSIGRICDVMTEGPSTDNVARLANLTKIQSQWIPADLMSRIDTGEPDYWGYQTCAEFGFYQTCEVGSQCMFAQGYDLLADQMAFCSSEFKIPASQVATNIDLTNAVYGGNTPVGSCLTYPNGEVDPWHALSILTSPAPGITALMVPGASHHAWTHPSLPTDQDSVKAARVTIRGQVDSYLSQSCGAEAVQLDQK